MFFFKECISPRKGVLGVLRALLADFKPIQVFLRDGMMTILILRQARPPVTNVLRAPILWPLGRGCVQFAQLAAFPLQQVPLVALATLASSSHS